MFCKDVVIFSLKSWEIVPGPALPLSLSHHSVFKEKLWSLECLMNSLFPEQHNSASTHYKEWWEKFFMDYSEALAIMKLLDQGAFKNDQKNEARKSNQLHYSFHFHLHVSHTNMASDNLESFTEQLDWDLHAGWILLWGEGKKQLYTVLFCPWEIQKVGAQGMTALDRKDALWLCDGHFNAGHEFQSWKFKAKKEVLQGRIPYLQLCPISSC